MHVPRRRRQTTQSTLDSLHGDAPLAAGRAHVRVRRRGHARDPRPWPARFINSRQGAGAGLAWRDVRALHCMHHAWLSRLARASCLHALQQRGRPRAEQRARLALASFDAYAWHGRRGQLLLCLQQRAGGRPRAEQRAFVWIGGFSFLVRGIQRSFSDPVCLFG